MKVLSNRWPDSRSILNVFAVVVVIIYGWTLYASFWKVPSWSFFLRLDEIFSIYAYAFTFNLIESLLLLAGCLCLSLSLPAQWWKEKFLSRSVTFVVIFMGSIMLHLLRYRFPDLRIEFVHSQKIWWSVTFALIILLVWLAPQMAWWRKLLNAIADRCLVFLYIFVPLSMLSALVVIGRAIF